jgi:hypothetical protein
VLDVCTVSGTTGALSGCTSAGQSTDMGKLAFSPGGAVAFGSYESFDMVDGQLGGDLSSTQASSTTFNQTRRVTVAVAGN